MSVSRIRILRVIQRLLITVILAFNPATPAEAAPPSPTIIAQAQASITVEAGEHTLVGLYAALLPGDHVPQHSHGGPDLILIFEGEVTNHKEGRDQTIRKGESWLDLPGEQHAITNADDTIAHLWASALLPKGDTSLRPSAQFPLNVQTDEYNLIGHVLDFAPGTEVAEHVHGGYVLSYILEGEITVLESGVSKQLKAYQSWTEIPEVAYSVTNSSGSKTRVATATLLPDGAEETTFVSSPTAASTGIVPTTENVSTAETAPNSREQFLPVLIAASLLLIFLGVGYYLRRHTS